MGRPDHRQGELAEKTIGLVGYGAIAREIAKRASAFDMRVIAVSRSERDCPAPLDWYGTMERLHELLDQSDYAVLTCELNDETRGLIDTAEFDVMGRETTLINVARADIVDEDALYTALKEKIIRGAILDVWYKYPTGPLTNPGTGGGMPSRYDFAALENVLMTPHCSANTEGTMTRRVLGMANNLNLVAKGERPATYIGEGTKP
jgi:phosphoglycerate dehydrogenase-like enzyme